MANTKVRGITIELSADASGVSKALSSVNSDINRTARELKDIDSLLKLDPTNTELLAQKHSALQTQIANTKSKVELLKKAEEDLASQMKDGGTESQQKQMAALEREIISSEQSLNKYTSQLDDCTSETKKLEDSQKAVEQSTGQLKEGFTVLKGVVANLVTDGLKKAVEVMKDLATSAPAFADDILTLSQVTSLSTDSLQEYTYMAGLMDVEVSTVTGSLKKLTKNMLTAQDGTGDAADSFKALGVSITDSNGQLRKAEDVFNDTIDALGELENETQRDAYAMTIFGKSAMDLNPLIEAGSEGFAEFAQEARDMGYVLDGEALDALGAVQDEFDRWEKQVESVKNTIGAGFAPALQRAMKKVNEIVKSIDWKAVGKSIGDAFNKIIDVFEWIIKNGNAVKSVLTGIVAAFAANKIATFVTTMNSAVTALKTATVAQEGMNAAANANPYVLLATAIIGVTAALVKYCLDVEKARYATSEYGAAQIKLAEESAVIIAANEECANSYEAIMEAQNTSVSATEAEINQAKKLAKELENYIDVNGNVKEGDEARADFILKELNSAMGTEYDSIASLIAANGNLAESIDAVLEKRRADVILQAQEETYKQAIINRDEAEKQLAETEQKRLDIQAQIAANEALIDSTAIEEDRRKIALANQDLIATLEELDASYKTQADVVDGYYYAITQYEDNYVKVHEGNANEINATSWEIAKQTGQATHEQSETIKKETDAQYLTWTEAMSNQLSAITGKQIEFKDAGNGLVQCYIDGVEFQQPKTAEAAKSMATGMLNTINGFKTDMETAGGDLAGGVETGLNSRSGGVADSMWNFGSNLLSTFKGALGINSPSKEMIKAMGYVADGISVGLDKNKKSVLNDVDEFGEDVADEMTKSMMQVEAGNYGLNASMNGTIGNVGTMTSMLRLMQTYMPNLNNGTQIVMDSGELVGAIAPKMNNRLGTINTMKLRGV